MFGNNTPSLSGPAMMLKNMLGIDPAEVIEMVKAIGGKFTEIENRLGALEAQNSEILKNQQAILALLTTPKDNEDGI